MTSWVDDFTAPALHPRWELLSGVYTPPGLGGGLGGAQVVTRLSGADCEIGVRGTVGQEQTWAVYVTDAPFGQETLFAGVWFDAGYVAIETEQGDEVSTVAPSPTDLVTLRIVDGTATVLVNSTPVASAPTSLGDTKWLTVSVDGPGPVTTPRITHIGYVQVGDYTEPAPEGAGLYVDGHVTGVYAGGWASAVYVGSTLVWSAIVTVTPQAPTFLAGAPWYTLPAHPGVAYSITGTPGYGATVTITATAQPGYEIVGTSSWAHTYGPPPRYTASDSGSYGSVNTTGWRTITTHVIAGAGGPASGTWRVDWTVSHLDKGVRVLLDDSAIATYGPSRDGNSRQSVTIPEREYAPGQQLTFQGISSSSNTSVPSWWWSLS